MVRRGNYRDLFWNKCKKFCVPIAARQIEGAKRPSRGLQGGPGAEKIDKTPDLYCGDLGYSEAASNIYTAKIPKWQPKKSVF